MAGTYRARAAVCPCRPSSRAAFKGADFKGTQRRPMEPFCSGLCGGDNERLQLRTSRYKYGGTTLRHRDTHALRGGGGQRAEGFSGLSLLPKFRSPNTFERYVKCRSVGDGKCAFQCYCSFLIPYPSALQEATSRYTDKNFHSTFLIRYYPSCHFVQ